MQMATSADYYVVIRDLKERRAVLDAAIVALERVLPVVNGTVSREAPEALKSESGQN